MEGSFPEKLLGVCVTARNCREALMERGERLRPINGLSRRRRRRGRGVRKMDGGSQCNHSALSPSAERKGKRHSQTKLRAWGNPAFVSKDTADPVTEQPKPRSFLPVPVQTACPLLATSPRGSATIAGLCGGFPCLHDLRSHTMRQRNLVKPGARMVFGPLTPDPPTI